MIIDLHGEGGGLQAMALAQRKEDTVEPFGGKSVLSLGNQIQMNAKYILISRIILILKRANPFDFDLCSN